MISGMPVCSSSTLQVVDLHSNCYKFQAFASPPNLTPLPRYQDITAILKTWEWCRILALWVYPQEPHESDMQMLTTSPSLSTQSSGSPNQHLADLRGSKVYFNIRTWHYRIFGSVWYSFMGGCVSTRQNPLRMVTQFGITHKTFV